MTDIRRLSGEDLHRAIEEPGVFLLDVREPREIAESGTVTGATNIPLGDLASKLAELPRDRPILTA